jgi:hypothetical protein
VGLYVSRRGHVGYSTGCLGGLLGLFVVFPILIYQMLKMTIVLSIWFFGACVWLTIACTKGVASASSASSRYWAQRPKHVPAGWYHHPADYPGTVRYWDGRVWTGWFR